MTAHAVSKEPCSRRRVIRQDRPRRLFRCTKHVEPIVEPVPIDVRIGRHAAICLCELRRSAVPFVRSCITLPFRDFPALHHRRPGSRSTRVPCLFSSTVLDGHPVLPGNHVLPCACAAMRRRLCDAGFRHNFEFPTHDRYRHVRAARRSAVLTLDVEFRESIVEKENLPGAPAPTMRLNGRDSALRSALTARSIESRMAAMTPQRTIQFGD